MGAAEEYNSICRELEGLADTGAHLDHSWDRLELDSDVTCLNAGDLPCSFCGSGGAEIPVECRAPLCAPSPEGMPVSYSQGPGSVAHRYIPGWEGEPLSPDAGLVRTR